MLTTSSIGSIMRPSALFAKALPAVTKPGAKSDSALTPQMSRSVETATAEPGHAV